ncbi:type II secretory pathway protein [Aliiglaciecola sp. M165]|uniref:type II secretory pathway protein n=1 Tax=Aliiglaciecola sp. M165 TaxID=2593649 RepID=UPI0021B095CD|nr:type II secretory pathway protein [Aliiglaciecola sp. M165]
MRLNYRLKRQQGSMLVIALFVIIIMALLGLTMVRLLSASADAVIHEVYGVRALQAAQSSLERQIQLAFPLTQDLNNEGQGNCVNGATSTKLFVNVPGLENCLTVASCSPTDGFAGETVTHYSFESTATCGAGKVIASRTVAVDAIVE